MLGRLARALGATLRVPDLGHASRSLRVLGAALFVAWSCADRGASVPWPADRPLLRWIDHLGAARIESPLQGIAGLDPGALIAAAPAAAFWRADLEAVADGTAPSGLAHARGCAGEAGGGLACGGAFDLGLRFGVEPGTHVRLRLRGASEPAGCAELRLIEPRQEVRVAPLGGPQGVHLRTGFATRWLELGLHPREGAAQCEARVEEIVAERLALGRREELALLAGEAPAEGADPRLGMAKAGYFLPAVAEQAGPPYDENYSYREALLAPPPTRVGLRVRLRPGARLRLGYGLHRSSALGSSVTFEVAIRSEGEPETILLRERLAARPEEWYWHEARIDLAHLAGREVEITLATSADAGAAAVPLWADPLLEVPRRRGDPPNVVLVAIDTLRADRVGSLGEAHGSTPHLDALARRGLLFRQAVSPGNWTLPAFASIFSGQTPQRHGVLRHLDALAGETTTLAEVFRRHAWATEAILYKPTLYLGNRLEQGFERYFNVPAAAPQCERNLEKALSWLRDNADRRFFLFLHFNDPHLPFNQPPALVSPELRGRLASWGLELPLDVEAALEACEACAEPAVRRRFQAFARDFYDSEVRHVDGCVGRFVGELERLGLFDESLLVAFSDHGETLWENGLYYGHGGPSFRDNLLHVPLVLKPPAGVGPAPGTVLDAQVSTLDLMPTLLELAGIPPLPGAGEARSLSRLWSAPGAPVEPAVVYSRGHQGESVRDGRWKYVREIQPGGGGAEMLFDRLSDPAETTEAGARAPEVRERLRAAAVAESAHGAGGGILLLVIAGPEEAVDEVEVRVEGGLERTAFDHYGLPLAGCAGGRCRYRGAHAGALVLADLLTVPAEATGVSPGATHLEVELRSAGRTRATHRLSPAAAPLFDPRELASLLDPPRPGAHLLRVTGHGAPGRGGEPRVLHSDQLEALRALGYIDR